MNRALLVLVACGPRPEPPFTPPPIARAASYAAAAEPEALAVAEHAWHDARACLVGDPPRAADVRDAIDLELLAGLRDCRVLVRRVGWPKPRPEALEAWDVLREATRALADIAGTKTDKPRFADEAVMRAAAIRDVDDARALAGLPGLTGGLAIGDVVPVTGPDAMRAAARPSPGIPIEWITSSFWFASDHVVAIQGKDGFIVARGPTDIVAFDAHGVSASLDGTWGAVASKDERILAGNLSNGELVSPVVAFAKPSKIIRVLGTGAQRAILVTELEAGDFALVSTDGGAHWSKGSAIHGSEIATQETTAADFLTPTEWTRVRADGKAVTRQLFDLPGSDRLGLVCASGMLWWIGATDHRLHFDDGTHGDVIDLPAGFALLRCSGTAAILFDETRLVRCAPSGCGEPVPIGGPSTWDLPVDLTSSGFVHAVQLGRVVEVWRDAGKPAYGRVADGEFVAGLVVWADVPYLVIAGPNGARIARLP